MNEAKIVSIAAGERDVAGRRRVFEQVCDSIRQDLANGVLKEGDKLPAEREIAGQLGVSRSVVREAIRALEATGLLQLKKGVNGGAYITHADGAAFVQSMQDVVLRGNLSLHDLTEVRMQLLVTGVAIAAARRTPADVRALQLNLEETAAQMNRFEEDGDASALVAPVANFSKLIGTASKNKLLSILINAVTDIQMHAFITLNMPFDFPFLAQRRDIVERIAAQDSPGAIEKMVSYLSSVHEQIVEFVRQNEPASLSQWLPPSENITASAWAISEVNFVRSKPDESALEALRSENTRLKILLADALLKAREKDRP